MSVKLRFKRIGKKKVPFYRLVAIDSRKRRDGKPLETIGSYDPRSAENTLHYDQERFVYWLSNGAQASDRVRTTLLKQGDWKKLLEMAHR